MVIARQARHARHRSGVIGLLSSLIRVAAALTPQRPARHWPASGLPSQKTSAR
jgi:hypothetical protein